MASKSLTPEQNEAARAIVRKLLETQYSGKQVDAADAFGVSQSILSQFLSGTKGMGAKLLAGISRRAPEAAARILGSAHVEQPRSPEPSILGLEETTREMAMELLTDRGYPYRQVRAALAGVGIYESEREPRKRQITGDHAARLAAGLLDQDLAGGSRGSKLSRARAGFFSKAQELAKRTDRVTKRRAGKER